RSSIPAAPWGRAQDYWRLLARGLLLAGHGALGALAGTGVGLGALPVHGQPTAVAQPLVAADLDLATDVCGDLATQVTLELVVRLEVVTQSDEFVVAQVLHSGVRGDTGRGAGLGGAGASHAEDVGERNLEPLFAGEVDADESCQLNS